MNKNPSRGIYIPTTSKVHPIYEKGHPYYENVHPFYEKRTSQLRVKYILTTSKEVRKCKFFILGGLFLLYELYFSKTAEEDILVYPQSFTPLILVLHQCSPLRFSPFVSLWHFLSPPLDLVCLLVCLTFCPHLTISSIHSYVSHQLL